MPIKKSARYKRNAENAGISVFSPDTNGLTVCVSSTINLKIAKDVLFSKKRRNQVKKSSLSLSKVLHAFKTSQYYFEIQQALIAGGQMMILQ